MKAPDKIYLRQIPDQKVEMFWYHKRGKFCENHEYIRKDAILEWVNGMKEGWGDIGQKGVILVLDELIDRIKSL